MNVVLIYMQKFSPISPSALIGKISVTRIFVQCYDYIEDMVTFTTLVKLYSTEYFCNTKVAGLAKFCQAKIFMYTVLYIKVLAVYIHITL